MNEKIFRKIADLQIEDGTFMNQGREKKRYQTIGAILSTPHGTRIFGKIFATLNSPSKIINFKMGPGYQLRVEPNPAETKGEENEQTKSETSVV